MNSRRIPRIHSNIATNNRAIAITSKVAKLSCTMTLSMITWVINGEAKPNNCKVKEANKTSPNNPRYFHTAGVNQPKLNFSCWEINSTCHNVPSQKFSTID